MKKLFGLANVAFASTALLAACGSSSSSSSFDDATLKVGITTLDDITEPLWNKVRELAESKGAKIELVEFTGYNQSNEALQDDGINVNIFQHKYFLSDWNSEGDRALVEVADMLLSPIHFFSGTDSDGDAKYTDVSDIPNRGAILIPSDASNESRTLYLLRSTGLIELDVSDDELATVKDISSNPKNLDIREVGTAQTASTLTSVDAAVISNSYAQSADVDYNTTLCKETVDENSNQWTNIVAAQKDWEKSDKVDAIRTLVSVYQTDEIGKIIEGTSEGANIPAWDSTTASSSSSDDD